MMVEYVSEYLELLIEREKGELGERELEVTKEAYLRDFMEVPGFFDLKEFWWEYVLDASFYHGPRAAAKFVQRVCNTDLMVKKKIEVDGKVGPVTVAAAYMVPPRRIREGMWLQQMYRYIDVVEGDPKARVFLRGWMDRINDLHEVP